MSRIIIHVEIEDGRPAKDLDVPAGVKGRDLALRLAQTLDWHSEEYRYSLAVERPLHKSFGPDQSLAEAGLWDGTHLVLHRKPDSNYVPARSAASPSSQSLAMLGSTHSPKTYPITMNVMIIGRFTARTTPTDRRKLIDLTDEPDSDTVSRKHARLLFEDGNWYLKVYPNTHNRTFCGDKQVESGGKHQLRDGDRLKFGRVTLRFKQTNQSEG